MAIERLETFTNEEASVVRVTATDGEQGIGQLSPYNADIAADVFHRQVAPHALGEDEERIEDLARRVVEREMKFPGSYVRRALCGLDTALWDLRGKRAGAPVCELLGGEPTDLAVYGSSMSREIEPEAEAERLARLREERGYDAFKIRIGAWDSRGRDEDQWPGRTEALVPAVRAAVGEDATLFVDANSAYTPERALEVDREVLAPNDVAHFEEPCPYWKLDWTREVRANAATTVAGGEQDCFLEQWRRIVDGVVDVAQPDVCYVGGLSRALAVCEMAAEADLPVRPHAANHSMVLAFTLHLLAAVDNAAPYVEYSVEDHWAEGMLHPAPEVRDGAVAVPDDPGWGVAVDDEWLATAQYESSST